jgi:hypothetical protein
MGRTAANIEASEGNERRELRRPSRAASFYRPSGTNADGAPTVRNVIPWHDIETRLAERLAAKVAAGEREKDAVPSKSAPPWKSDADRPPESGVRLSEGDPSRELTYSVYTVADLEARGQARARVTVAPPSPRPSRWPDVWKSAVGLLRVGWAWVRASSPRPHVGEVCNVPLQQLLTDFKTALRGVPWRKLAAGSGIAVGALLVLVLAILATAELTDDLKPARTTVPRSERTESTSTASLAPNDAPPDNAPSTPAKPPTAPDFELLETIEIDDAPPPAASGPPKPPAWKPKRPVVTTTTKKSGELLKP